MSEWLKEHAWKACVGETLPWVRIPLSPPTFARDPGEGRPTPESCAPSWVRVASAGIASRRIDGMLHAVRIGLVLLLAIFIGTKLPPTERPNPPFDPKLRIEHHVNVPPDVQAIFD